MYESARVQLSANRLRFFARWQHIVNGRYIFILYFYKYICACMKAHRATKGNNSAHFCWLRHVAKDRDLYLYIVHCDCMEAHGATKGNPLCVFLLATSCK